MIQLTKRTEYGLIALIHIADRGGSVVSVREIGESYPVPRRLLAEVVKDLARAGIVESQRGATGGYVLARSADRITLGDVVVALEGAPLVMSCEAHGDAGGSTCDVEPVCPIRSPLHRLREGIWKLMERTTLTSLRSASPLIGLESPDFSTAAISPSAKSSSAVSSSVATTGPSSVIAHGADVITRSAGDVISRSTGDVITRTAGNAPTSPS